MAVATTTRTPFDWVLGTAVAIPAAPEHHSSFELSPLRACSIPLAFTLALAAFVLLPQVRHQPRLMWSFAAAVAPLLLWNAALCATRLRHRTLVLEVVLRKQHYIQACAQGAVLIYWGWHWRQVYDYAYLIAAQLLFAYAFDMLLAWSRRDRYTLGFGPFPVIFSINLFLWFRQEWFFLQFLMVAVGFAAKELLRWEKDGRPSHIFNPSSFPLAVFSLVLLALGASDMTWGRQIATTQFYPPNMYAMLFLIGLPGQFFFGVTSMTMSAVVTTYVIGVAYHALTGVYFFYDSYIPIAVFLGMHLLFTDPSTSPRTELGRIIFGMLYGASTVLLYQVLGTAGLPTFYDKLLQVPVLNLSIKLIDRAAQSDALRRLDPAALGRSLLPRQRHLAYIAVWLVVFSGMTAANGVGDRHEGQWLPFWQQACEAERPFACAYLAQQEAAFCDAGSGWACNEYGLLQTERDIEGPGAASTFDRGCAIGFGAACLNLDRVRRGAATLVTTRPRLDDYPIILRGSKGEITQRSPAALYAQACRQGWPETCDSARLSGSR
jgi:hypothetical protein